MTKILEISLFYSTDNVTYLIYVVFPRNNNLQSAKTSRDTKADVFYCQTYENKLKQLQWINMLQSIEMGEINNLHVTKPEEKTPLGRPGS
jgi:hypothetical protein